jgi:hypothetical protein
MSKDESDIWFEQREQWLSLGYTQHLLRELKSKEAPLFELLLRAAQSSSDPAVRAAAARIESLRQFMTTYEREAVEESDG